VKICYPLGEQSRNPLPLGGGSSTEITKDIPKNRITELKGYERVKHYRRSSKLRAVEYKGGNCVLCGYDKCIRSLSFHHLDPNSKDFSISKNTNKKWDVVKTELDKCILVCMNCHMEIHSGIHNNNPVMAKLVKAFG
jgi:hypothetical protein